MAAFQTQRIWHRLTDWLGKLGGSRFKDPLRDLRPADCCGMRSAWDPECAELCSVVTQCCPGDSSRLIDMIDEQIPLEGTKTAASSQASHPPSPMLGKQTGIDGSG